MTRCRAEIRTYYLPDEERMRYVLSHGRGYKNVYIQIFIHIQVSFVFPIKKKIKEFKHSSQTQLFHQ